MTFRALLALITVMAMFASPVGMAQAPSAGNADVAIMSAHQLTHAATEPLLLAVHLYNGVAQQIAASNVMNERHAADAQASERFRKLPATTRARRLAPFAQRPVPAVSLGAPGRALTDFVRFSVQAVDGSAVALSVRPLANASVHRNAIRLDDRRSVILAYGIDASAFAALGPGVYAIRAHVDTSSERGMWAGRTTSRPVMVTLQPQPSAETPQARVRRLLRAGEFHLADQQFGRAEALAREIVAADEGSVDGWVLLGDALDGSGRLQDALEMFVRALKVANDKTVDGGEAALYVQERIIEVQAALQRR